MIFPTLHLKIERWKFNSDYGVYVSTEGQFRDRQKRLIPIKIKAENGYCTVRTEVNSSVLAHRLVLLTWKPIPDAENLTVDHLDHNKRHNSVSNLEWVSFEENQKRAKEDLDYIEVNLKKESQKAKKKADRLEACWRFFKDLPFGDNKFYIETNGESEIISSPKEMYDYIIKVHPGTSPIDAMSKAQSLQNMLDGANVEGTKGWGKGENKITVKIIRSDVVC